MPSHLRMKVAYQFHDGDAKNQAVINPCFRRQVDILDPTSGTDAQALCDDLANAIKAWSGRTAPLTVSAYNIQGAKPNYPLATTKLDEGGGPIPLSCPPELAICLSFYASVNQPRKRGRLYVPSMVAGVAASDCQSKIPAAKRTTVAGLVPIFAGLGGSNVDWIVWSHANGSASKVTNWWVDDAWDVIRSRGIKSTARDTGSTSG